MSDFYEQQAKRAQAQANSEKQSQQSGYDYSKPFHPITNEGYERNIALALEAGDYATAKGLREAAETRGLSPSSDNIKSNTQDLQQRTINSFNESPQQPQEEKQGTVNFSDVKPPEQYTPKATPAASQRTIQPGQVENSIPGWWDYMKQTSGGKAGAISRMASGVLQGLGNAASNFAHGASLGKVPGSNSEVKGDPFGLQGYGQLQNDFIKNQQGLNTKAAEMNMQGDQFWNNHQLELEKVGINHEMNKELQSIAAKNNFDIAKMQQEMTMKLMEKNFTLQAANMAVNTFMGLMKLLPGVSVGGFTGEGDKYEPAGIVHKGEYVIPKEDVDQSTGLPRKDFMLKVLKGQPYGTSDIFSKRKIKKTLTSQDKLKRLDMWLKKA